MLPPIPEPVERVLISTPVTNARFLVRLMIGASRRTVPAAPAELVEALRVLVLRSIMFVAVKTMFPPLPAPGVLPVVFVDMLKFCELWMYCAVKVMSPALPEPDVKAWN